MSDNPLGAILRAAAGYDTQLSPQDQARFDIWRLSLPENLRNDQDYDLHGAFLADAQAATNGHLTDRFKKPNHMTFSDGSQYSTPQMPGGHWGDTGQANPQQPGQHAWNFWASPENVRQHGVNEMTDYFRQREPGNNVIFPFNYKLPRR